MDNLDNIKNFRFWCQPILPLVYDDSLSYYEALCKFNTKLNEVIDRINNFQEDIEEMVDNKISILKNYVDSENAKQDANFDKKINELEEAINLKIELIYQYIKNVKTEIYNYVNYEILELKKYIDNSILGQIIIYDPTTGYKNRLDKVINNIYDALRYWGITCYQFDSAENTAKEFDSKQITALKFDTLALQILGKFYNHYIFDPINGAYETIQRVLYRWFQVYRTKAITANTFDGNEDTATILDGFEYSAYEFDDIGESLIIPR